ncbi:uncharacterized protein JCM6883_002215 [Sporobolomyces salmoneus]|uniref:uncharacterized protein n=1 Tax=Sporobolomyces salmoneus TaxID=183962 RepID=UPI0031808E0C
MTDRDTSSLSSDPEKDQARAHENKPAPTTAHLEHYVGKPGYSYNLAAVQEARGFKQTDGRLVVDPAEARVEFGEEIASKLKTNRKGTKILWPQPTDDPNDPQNWSARKKNVQLAILTMAAFVPDFASGLGIASLFELAETFTTSVDHINQLTSNWSIFMLGPGGIVAAMAVKRYGRLPVLFWSQFIGLGFLIGCALAPNLEIFAAMRILNAFFSTAPQAVGLWSVADLYPFHLQNRKLSIWTFGFIASPFVSPFLLGYLAASKGSFRDVYWVGVAFTALVVLLIVFVSEETMYDREVTPIPERPTTGIRYRIETLVGITGVKMAKYRCSWKECLFSWVDVLWRPSALIMYIYVGVTFGFGIGINVTNAVFTGSPPPLGYGFSPYVTSSLYAIPIVGVIIGELAGKYITDGITNRLIKRNSGVFYAEYRLWSIYFAIPFFVAGFVLLGACFEKKLPVVALIFGWGLAQIGIVISTVGVYSYLMNCYPTRQGEVAALINWARVLGGFAIPYYQTEFSLSAGPMVCFGMEAGIGAGLFAICIPTLQIYGARLRAKFPVKHY